MNHWDWVRYGTRRTWGWLNEPLIDPERVRALVPIRDSRDGRDPTHQAVKQAIRDFGYDVVGNLGGPAIIIPNGSSRDGDQLVVAYHARPFRPTEPLGVGARHFSYYSQVIPMSTEDFENGLAEAQQRSSNPTYQALLGLVSGHFRAGKRHFCRGVFVTAPKWLVLEVTKGAPNAVGRGEVVCYRDYGPMLRATACRVPINWRGWGGLDRHPLLVAHDNIQWDGNHYRLGGDPVQHAIWLLRPRNVDQALVDLHRLPVDYFLHCESLGAGTNELWIRGFFVRASGTTFDLGQITNSLNTIGYWWRVPGDDILGKTLRRFHYATLPGSPSIPPIWPTPVEKWDKFLRNAVVPDAVGVACGNLPLGHSFLADRRPIFENWGDPDEPDKPGVNSLLIVGPQGAGKTTEALVRGLCRRHGPNVWLFQVKRARSERAGRLIERCGGDYILLRLPEPANEKEYETAYRDVVRPMVDATMAELEDDWGNYSPKSGRPPVGFPRAVRLETGSEILYADYLTYFLKRGVDLISRCHRKIGEVVITLDDPAGLTGYGQSHLPNKSVEVVKALREQVKALLSTGRELGIKVIVCMHGIGQLNDWPGGLGLWQAAGWCLLLVGGRFDLAGLLYTQSAGLDFSFDLVKYYEALTDPDPDPDSQIPVPPDGFLGLIDRELSPEIVRLMDGT